MSYYDSIEGIFYNNIFDIYQKSSYTYEHSLSRYVKKN